jgi:phosphoglycolate phosphatase-like HAD superfamily hydrolase
MSNLIIFDLDGVITNEEAYWDAAGLTLHEMLYNPRYWNLQANSNYSPAATAEESRRISRSTLPESEIMAYKARSINSNWDTCYVAICLRLINLLKLLHKQSLDKKALAFLMPLRPWDSDWIAAFREQARHLPTAALPTLNTSLFDSPPFLGHTGLELINRFDDYASEVLEMPIQGVFSRYSPFWAFCRDIFQEWYLGDELYTQTYGHAPAQMGKPGCIHFERPLLPSDEVRMTLETLRQQGYSLGFATGRDRQEADYPLEMYGLLHYFDEQHTSTYDDVERVEAKLRARDDRTLLSKPHPFQFLFAADHDYEQAITQPGMSTSALQPCNFLVVGDSTSDIRGGQAAGALTVAVSTGLRTAEARSLLMQSNPDFTLEDMRQLPALLAEIDSLVTIQRLQFSDRKKAERLLQRWFAHHMHLATESITLMPKAVSLNSFNGFYHSDGEEYFFKTHVEEQGIVEEYYHAELLSRAGYNIVRPLRALHEKERQMVIYPVIRWPVVFDLMRAVETGDASNASMETLVSAEMRECERLLGIYRSTLASVSKEAHAAAPIHQLFWHRITGGRFRNFYSGKFVRLPTKHGDRQGIAFDELLGYRWVINGNMQQKTLGELVERARIVLDPQRASATVIGHGDAHFGNVFLENKKQYLYFDPAFAGRHSPLLDVIKPLFHNIFATWMYFPYDVASNLHVTVSVDDANIAVEHDYALPPVRQAILQTKLEHLLTPMTAELDAQNALPTDWREMMQLALMCCPLLTINLLDEQRIPPAISWLGLLLAVQMGNSGIQTWRKKL